LGVKWLFVAIVSQLLKKEIFNLDEFTTSVLKNVSAESLFNIILFLLALLPTVMICVWKYLGFHYKERHDANEHRIIVLKENLAGYMNASELTDTNNTWDKANKEIEAMESLITKRAKYELEDKDKEILNQAKKQALIRIDLQCEIEIIKHAIKVFMEEEDRAFAYASMANNGDNMEDLHAKIFRVNDELLNKYLTVIKEAETASKVT
jgi:hypothetical protein